MKFRPFHDRIIVKEVSEATSGGIELPFTKSAHKHGRVVAVGDGTRFPDGKLLPVRVSPGDRIVFEGGTTIRLEGEEYTMIREPEIVGIVPPPVRAVESDVA
jgi:chaperonin GroES